jgi:hypothetical protein
MKMLVLICGLISFSTYAAEIKVPAKNLLNAAKTIKYQTGPYYSANGDIKCTVINTGWSPATSTCEINIDGSTANVEKPESLIDAVAKFKAPTGPHYSFSGKFKASSVSSQVPPYKVSESAMVIFE